MAAEPLQPQPQYPDASAHQPYTVLENPFLFQVQDGGGSGDGSASGGGGLEPHAPATVPLPAPAPDQRTPPTYTEVVRRPVVDQRRDSPPGEMAPLLSRQDSSSTLNDIEGRRVIASDHVRQQRGVIRALLLWLGIGQWYSGLCIFISFIFFSGGAVVMVLSVLNIRDNLEIMITTTAAGSIFILISILWPCAWLWNQWNMTCGCSYAPFLTYTWVLSLVYAGIVGALVFGVNEHYNCITSCEDCPWIKNNNNSSSSDDDEDRLMCAVAAMPLWVLMAMLALAVVVFLLGYVYCCGMCLLGNEEPRRPRRRYTRL